MIDKNYLARHAAVLLKLAWSTADRDVAAALISKAADLKARIDDEASRTDAAPLASRIEPAA